MKTTYIDRRLRTLRRLVADRHRMHVNNKPKLVQFYQEMINDLLIALYHYADKRGLRAYLSTKLDQIPNLAEEPTSNG